MMSRLILNTFIFLQWKYCLGELSSTSITLDLSNRGITSEDFFTKIQFSNDTREVTELILCGNELDRFNDCSTSLISLKTLDLSYNKLKTFSFLYSQEGTLLSLNVSHNHLDYIDDRALSYTINQLKILDMSFNDIYIVNGMFQHLKNLEFLSLASNPIQEMDDNVFQNLTKLKHFDLRNTTFERLMLRNAPWHYPTSIFEPLINLEYLDLSWNQIGHIPPLPMNIQVLYICGINIEYFERYFLPHLRVVHADYSPKLTTLLMTDLENLFSIEELSFHDSPRLSRVDIESGTGDQLLPHLKILSLQNCALETLDENLLPILQKTRVVNLQNNPWRCDCKLKWMNTLKLSNDLISNVRCQSPSNHKNRLLNITVSELVCEPEMLDDQRSRALFDMCAFGSSVP